MRKAEQEERDNSGLDEFWNGRGHEALDRNGFPVVYGEQSPNSGTLNKPLEQSPTEVEPIPPKPKTIPPFKPNPISSWRTSFPNWHRQS